MEKPFWKSKTFWAGVIGIVIGILQYVQGQFVAGGEVAIASVIAIVLRSITSQPITLK